MKSRNFLFKQLYSGDIKLVKATSLLQAQRKYLSIVEPTWGKQFRTEMDAIDDLSEEWMMMEIPDSVVKQLK